MLNAILFIALTVVLSIPVFVFIIVFSLWCAHLEMTNDGKLVRHELSSNLSRFKNEFEKMTDKFYASSRFKYSLFVEYDYDFGDVWDDNQIHAKMFVVNGCMYKFGFFDYFRARLMVRRVYNQFVSENKFEPNNF